jgi:proteasome accessory factor C
VRRLALRLGEDGRLVEPAELAAGVRKEAAAALAQYGSGAAGGGSDTSDGSPPTAGMVS